MRVTEVLLKIATVCTQIKSYKILQITPMEIHGLQLLHLNLNEFFVINWDWETIECVM